MSNFVSAQFVLQEPPRVDGKLLVNVAELCSVAKHTLNYLEQYPEDDFAVHSGSALVKGVTLERVKHTLRRVCQLAQNKQKLSIDALKQSFDFYRWYPDKNYANALAKQSTNAVKTKLLSNIPEDKIFLTKYYTKLLKASEVKTDVYNQALYALPYDEQSLSLEQAEQQKEQLTRFQYTRQQILTGVLDQKNLAKPLVWLTEEALHDVLLQGTGVVELNGKRRYFNVHRNNGIAYDYAIGKREQARYWYFAEVPSILGYGKTIDSKISILPEVTFAGNVKQLGLGKLFLINYRQDDGVVSQMGVLADQGGAFDNNLFQLDFLKGSYYGWQDYYQANKHLPDYANAWMLLAKE